MTVLMVLSSIAMEQMKATEKTLGRCIQLLDYLASNSEAKVRYYASDMVMNIRSSSQDDTDGTSSIVLPCPGS